ncbi:solute carrier family 23 protein [Latilactobacillus curvatus]
MDKNIDIATESRTNWFERQFKIKASGSTIKTEIIAGITTFIAMSYILFVNPTILGDAGLDKGAVFVATALTGVVGCLAMAFIANYPIAVAPGLGSNAFFAYSVVLGMGIPWQTALAGVFVASLLFMLVTVLKVREVVINAIPANLKAAMAVGIAAGGRTGFTAVVVAIMFVLSLFFSPLLAVVTSQVTAPILIIVGSFMMKSIANIDWSEFETSFAAFMIILCVPLTYNISYGLAFGLITYPITMIAAGKGKKVHPIMYVAALLFLLLLFTMHELPAK